MATRLFAMLLVIGGLSAGGLPAYAEGPKPPHPSVELSPGLRDLLRTEMREIAGGMQDIALSLATADWKAIQETSTKMRASYILEKELTPAQEKELAEALPERFKQLDAEFHQRAERLGSAAAAHDPELVAFQYSRLVESCAVCHSAYARSRFPGFAPPVQEGHRH